MDERLRQLQRAYHSGVIPLELYLSELERSVFGVSDRPGRRSRDEETRWEYHCRDCTFITHEWDAYRRHEDSTNHIIRTRDPLYPRGTKVLWYAHYRAHPESGDTDGPGVKIDGILVEAAIEAEKIGREEGLVLQCLRRRY